MGPLYQAPARPLRVARFLEVAASLRPPHLPEPAAAAMALMFFGFTQFLTVSTGGC